MHHSQRRGAGRLVWLVALLATLGLALVPAAGTTGLGNGLYAFVRADGPGPLPACSPADCTNANTVWHFVYVANLNRLEEVNLGPRTRATLQNAFVVALGTARFPGVATIRCMHLDNVS